MAAKGGRKYPLLLYEHILNRWWPSIFFLAVLIYLYVGVLWGAQWYYANPADNPFLTLSDESGMILIVLGSIVLIFGFSLLIARKMAYVQLFADHIKLATPFMRLNISYKRIQRTTTAQISNLYPPKSLSGTKREIIAPIAGSTAIVVHLTGYPMSRSSMRMFLSPLFFYDQTPHFVLVVDDWMKFSAELESRRVSGQMPRQAASQRSSSGLLDDLKKK